MEIPQVVQTDRVVKDEKGRLQRVVILDWSELKFKLFDFFENKKGWRSQPSIDSTWRGLLRDPWTADKWVGLSVVELLDQLRNGYHAPEFANSAERLQGATERRANWNDEDGDPDIGRMISGTDDFFLGMSERNTKPAITVQFETFFSCGVKAKVIAEYGAWLAGLMKAMETYGFDLTVDAWACIDELTTSDGRERSNILMRVKRQNEYSDFTEWSAILGPGIGRIFAFGSMAMACDKIGKKLTSFIGMSVGDRNWGLEYDREENIVRVTINQRAGGGDAFPRERLTKLAVEAGLIPSQE
jgi:hypothetical protein